MVSQGGMRSGIARFVWPVTVVVIWAVWYVVYAFAFAVINEALTRLGGLAADNGMLPPVMELTLQASLALVFGLAGVTLLLLARAPRSSWLTAAITSVVLALATVILWATSAAGAGADGIGRLLGTYLLVGAAMAAGCWLGAKIRFGRKVPAKIAGSSPQDGVTEIAAPAEDAAR